ncbi:MAG: LPS assembly protein LptD [Acidobacteria bacterium]|nr:LPS assembly protein LptD [Acidobacteriota bacterium]
MPAVRHPAVAGAVGPAGRSGLLRAGLLTALLGALAPVAAQETRVAKPELQLELPESARVRAGQAIRLETEWRLTGYVDVQAGDSSIQADEIVYTVATREVVATGNVVLSFPGATLSGTRLVYNIETQLGLVEDAVGYLDQDNAVVRAETIERIGPQDLRVTRAVFTTCTQPTPYWSFRVSRATLTLGQYAHLRDAAFKVGKVPIFYTPYLIWPIKTDRATGLLFPSFSTSTTLGRTISLPLFWAFADNADLTLLFNWHSEVGPGLGAELNWLPTWRGRARGIGNYIRDTERAENRYIGEWHQVQPFGDTWKLRLQIEALSDFDYLTDYVVDLNRASNPQVSSWVDLTRQWSWYSLTVRANRLKQYFPIANLLTNETLIARETINESRPEIELRSASHRIGRSPVFFLYEGSLSSFRRAILGPPSGVLGERDEDDLLTLADVNWLRADFFPQLQVPLLKVPWADLTVNAGWRWTYYTAQQQGTIALDEDRTQIVPNYVDQSLTRNLWNAGISFIGPRFQRIWNTPRWRFSPKLKNVIEPFVRYDWRPDSGVDPANIILYDIEVPSTERLSLTDLEEQAQREARRAVEQVGKPGVDESIEVDSNLTPTEIGSLQIVQQYSLSPDQWLSGIWAVLPAEVSGSSFDQQVIVDRRQYSPVVITGRFNPTYQQAVDLSYTFDVANDRLTETSLSAMMGFRGGYFRGSWFQRKPVQPLNPDTDFVRAQVGIARLARGLSLEAAWDYNLETSNLDHYFYQVRWTTQCCSIQLGYDVRGFVDNSRRNLLLTVNLSGIGKLFDLEQDIGN